MSLSQIFSRMMRIARSYQTGSEAGGDLRRAEELIEEARRRDEPDFSEIESATEKEIPKETPEGAMTYRRAIHLLRLREGATIEEIGRAYRAIIVEYHPDKRGDHRHAGREEAEARTRELNEAYAFLKDYLARSR